MKLIEREEEERLRLDVIASLRDAIRNISPDRKEEMFADFAVAIQSGDVDALADTVQNWALGGHGYDYTGADVTMVQPVITTSTDKETVAAWDEFWSNVDAK